MYQMYDISNLMSVRQRLQYRSAKTASKTPYCQTSTRNMNELRVDQCYSRRHDLYPDIFATAVYRSDVPKFGRSLGSPGYRGRRLRRSSYKISPRASLRWSKYKATS